MGAELIGRFIYRETGWVGGDFKEYAAGFVEVDGVEVLAVHDRGDAYSKVAEGIAPGQLVLVVGCAPGDMMHRAD